MLSLCDQRQVENVMKWMVVKVVEAVMVMTGGGTDGKGGSDGGWKWW